MADAMQTLADERGGPFAGQSLPWLICALVAAGANTWAVLALTARQSKWKPLELLMCALGGAHALNTALPIAMYAVLQLRKRASASYQWNEGLCKVGSIVKLSRVCSCCRLTAVGFLLGAHGSNYYLSGNMTSICSIYIVANIERRKSGRMERIRDVRERCD